MFRRYFSTPQEPQIMHVWSNQNKH